MKLPDKCAGAWDYNNYNKSKDIHGYFYCSKHKRKHRYNSKIGKKCLKRQLKWFNSSSRSVIYANSDPIIIKYQFKQNSRVIIIRKKQNNKYVYTFFYEVYNPSYKVRTDKERYGIRSWKTIELTKANDKRALKELQTYLRNKCII